MIFIYALLCPVTGNPRYIGKCRNPKARLASHLTKARGNHTKSHCANWLRTLLRTGQRPVILIVRSLSEEDDWQAAESECISKYRAMGFDLTNSTSGGDGLDGLDPEVVRRRGESRRKSLQDPETKARFLAAVVPSHSTPRAKQSHREGAERAWSDPAKREAMISGMREPEAVSRRAAATKRRHADPAYAAAHRERMRAVSAKPENREKLAAARAKRWALYKGRVP